MSLIQQLGQSLRLNVIMTLEFTVPNMACSACAETITKAVTALDASAKVTADSKTKQVNIETQADAAMVKAAITAAGYTVA